MELKPPYRIPRYRTHRLLIVPYGIETRVLDFLETREWLLIVPYGIETKSVRVFLALSSPFNRTLWN